MVKVGGRMQPMTVPRGSLTHNESLIDAAFARLSEEAPGYRLNG